MLRSDINYKLMGSYEFLANLERKNWQGDQARRDLALFHKVVDEMKWYPGQKLDDSEHWGQGECLVAIFDGQYKAHPLYIFTRPDFGYNRKTGDVQLSYSGGDGDARTFGHQSFEALMLKFMANVATFMPGDDDEISSRRQFGFGPNFFDIRSSFFGSMNVELGMGKTFAQMRARIDEIERNGASMLVDEIKKIDAAEVRSDMSRSQAAGIVGSSMLKRSYPYARIAFRSHEQITKVEHIDFCKNLPDKSGPLDRRRFVNNGEIQEAYLGPIDAKALVNLALMYLDDNQPEWRSRNAIGHIDFCAKDLSADIVIEYKSRVEASVSFADGP